MSLSIQQRRPAAEPIGFEEQSLAQAFAAFTEAASSLERSYVLLQTEVVRLRHELEATNRDLRRSLEENQRMRMHLNRILEGLPCGVLVTDANGSVSIANPETRRLLSALAGAAVEPLQQVPVWVQELLDDVAAGPLEREYRCRTENLTWIAVRRTKLETPAGGSSIFILRDISEAKRFAEAQDTLRRRQALAEMSALLAHEIRNPLGSLELFAALLAESKIGGECRQWAEQLQAGLRTLAATVNNVLHFQGQPAPEFLPTDLGQLLRWLERFLQPLAQQAGVRLAVAHELDGVLVAADHHRLEQVVLNLALNAFRLMPQGGTLKILGAVRDSGSPLPAEVEIADTGPGIAAENLDLIFEPGFTTRPGSPGLGLAVCKTIMEQHGGAIGVTSQVGLGSTFRLQFPVLEAIR